MKTLFTSLVILACLSCGPTFRSNINPGTRPDFHRVLVVSKLSTQLPDYMLDFVNSFPSGYEVCTLELGVLSFANPDSLLQEKRRQCNSEVMLTIQEHGNYVAGSGKSAIGVNETLLEMTDLATGKPFWKAIASSSGRWPGAPATIRRLISDGILAGKVRPYQPIDRTAQY